MRCEGESRVRGKSLEGSSRQLDPRWMVYLGNHQASTEVPGFLATANCYGGSSACTTQEINSLGQHPSHQTTTRSLRCVFFWPSNAEVPQDIPQDTPPNWAKNTMCFCSPEVSGAGSHLDFVGIWVCPKASVLQAVW